MRHSLKLLILGALIGGSFAQSGSAQSGAARSGSARSGSAQSGSAPAVDEPGVDAAGASVDRRPSSEVSRDHRIERLRRSGARSVRAMVLQAQRAFQKAAELRRNGDEAGAQRADRLGDAALLVAEHRRALREERGVLRQHERLVEAAEHRRRVAAEAVQRARQGRSPEEQSPAVESPAVESSAVESPAVESSEGRSSR